MRIGFFALALLAGCSNYQDVPQAHKGRVLDRESSICFGGAGLSGPVLGTGSYSVGFAGCDDELRLVDCSTTTKKEVMPSLTKDNVNYSLDVYVRYHADCSDDNVVRILDTMSPDQGNIVSSELLYATYVRPLLGESVREVMSPFAANDVNDKREEIIQGIKENFSARIAALPVKLIVIEETNLSNMDPPEEMDQANLERAKQAVLTQTAIAAQERVTAELTTSEMREKLSRQEGKTEAAKIEEIGAALERNPAYIEYLNTLNLPGIYEKAGATGNLVIAAPSPSIMVGPKAK